MRILADENFPKPIVDMLRAGWQRRALGSDRLLRLEGLCTAESRRIRRRIMLTLDKDFWQLAVQRRVLIKQSGVVLFRIHPPIPKNLEPLVRAFVQAYRPWAGHISIIAAHGIQMLSCGG